MLLKLISFDIKLCLHQYNHAFLFQKVEACGLRHLALEVDNIYESVDYLKSHGIRVENIRIDEITGKRFTFFPDPDQLP